MIQPLLYGIHDKQGAHILPAGGWIVDTVALSENPQPIDYSAIRADINWIVRLNWGYGSTGTIPLAHEYDRMAAACALYVAKSSGANLWIIGNEPNHEQERPNGVYITPEHYAECFITCRDAIKSANPRAQVLVAACAPYHANPKNWLEYYREMLTIIAANGGCDGLTLHTYTRSSDPADIDSGAQMGQPLQKTYSGFLSYLDALIRVPASILHLPVYITEFNELLPDGWHDANTGVVQAAYADIFDWNNDADYLPIMCLCLYRWPKFDKWYIEGKQGVIDDFQAAVKRGYKSPSANGKSEMPSTYIPIVGSGPVALPVLPPREWDERLTQRGVTVETPTVAPGQQFWRVTRARWYNEQESQGRHHIYVNAPSGTPFLVAWPSGSSPGVANGRDGFDAGNYPMSKSLNEFSVKMDNGIPSETLKGIGMGADGNSGIHTSTLVKFELVTMPQGTQPSTPQPEQPTTPQPTTPQPTPTGDNWTRCWPIVLKIEGGLSLDPNDSGNYYQGKLVGTKYGISAAVWGGQYDIPNLTQEQALSIYKQHYWDAAGCDALSWPLCLAVFDLAINGGVGRAQQALAEAGPDFHLYTAWRLDWYTRIDGFDDFGRGWVRRCTNLIREAAK